MALTLSLATLLEKAATDNGFDVPRPPEAEWLSFASTHAPLRIWLGADAEGRPVAALSRAGVVRALSGQRTAGTGRLSTSTIAASPARTG